MTAWHQFLDHQAVATVEANALKRAQAVFGIQQAQHHTLAEDCRQHREAQIDAAAILEFEAGAAVLGVRCSARFIRPSTLMRLTSVGSKPRRKRRTGIS